ncbi:MAG: peptide-methionine (S)-S-oxide reductase MsrA [Anaerolineae bacterium]
MNENTTSNNVEVTTLGGGCFWCLEAVYDELIGVTDVVSGYGGGTVPNPSYEQVCTGRTGHAEVVQVTFDPSTISFRDILEVFFSIHDPTTLNRQGADVGTQYRSVIFYHNERQKEIAEEMIDKLEAEDAFDDSIVTQIEPLDEFYPAESYHQEYYQNNPRRPYCRVVIAPKVKKFQKKYGDMLKVRL